MIIYLVYNPKPNYSISHSVTFMHEQFNLVTESYKEKFSFQVIDLSKKFYESNIDDFKNFIVNNTNISGKIIFFGRFFLTKKFLFDENFILKLKIKNEVLLWLDDLHKLYHNEILKSKKNSENLLKSKTINLIDKFITPSIIFFKNINSPFIEKTLYQFYSLNFYCFTNIKPFDERFDKIFLSGYIDSSYKTRSRLLKLYNTKKTYKKNIHYHQHPGYSNGNADPNYFQTLQNFKYAFIGLVNYPMNYCISKIIETLACGTLAFIEFSPLLKDELGLIPYEHYIPVLNNNLIDFNQLEKLKINNKDKKIADCGREHVLVNFDYRIQIRKLIKNIR